MFKVPTLGTIQLSLHIRDQSMKTIFQGTDDKDQITLGCETHKLGCIELYDIQPQKIKECQDYIFKGNRSSLVR